MEDRTAGRVSVRAASWLSLMLLVSCLRDAVPLPPLDATVADAAVTDAAVTDATETDATVADAPGAVDAPAAYDASETGDAAAMRDAAPSANTHALSLAGSEYLSITDVAHAGLDLAADFTLEAWIKLDQLPSADGDIYALAGKNDYGTTETSYMVYLQRDGSEVVLRTIIHGPSMNAGGRDLMQWPLTGLTTGQWHHVAVTFDVSASGVLAELALYFDGISIATEILLANGDLTAISNSTAPFTVGVWLPSGVPTHYFVGAIDDLRLWSQVRDGGTIAAQRSVELSGNEPGLVGYWKFNNDADDSSPSSNDLSDTGSVTYTNAAAF